MIEIYFTLDREENPDVSRQLPLTNFISKENMELFQSEYGHHIELNDDDGDILVAVILETNNGFFNRAPDTDVRYDIFYSSSRKGLLKLKWTIPEKVNEPRVIEHQMKRTGMKKIKRITGTIDGKLLGDATVIGLSISKESKGKVRVW